MTAWFSGPISAPSLLCLRQSLWWLSPAARKGYIFSPFGSNVTNFDYFFCSTTNLSGLFIKIFINLLRLLVQFVLTQELLRRNKTNLTKGSRWGKIQGCEKIHYWLMLVTLFYGEVRPEINCEAMLQQVWGGSCSEPQCPTRIRLRPTASPLNSHMKRGETERVGAKPTAPV